MGDVFVKFFSDELEDLLSEYLLEMSARGFAMTNQQVCSFAYELALEPPNFMKFGVRGHLTDVITCVKFLVNRFRGYGVPISRKWPFPIDLLRRPYNSSHCRATV